MTDRELKFGRLNKRIKECHRCKDLNKKGVTENAPGYGNVKSGVVIIGQSLCTQCMETQIPFTGGSGRILDEVFKEAGIKKKDIFITNLVHCHPPNNRPSTKEEIKKCMHYLLLEIDLIRPKLIITLGTDARNAITHMTVPWRELGMTSIKGWLYNVYSVYHPAYYYRSGTDTKEYIIDLARKIQAFSR